MRRYGLRFVALFYLAAILVGPLGIVFYRTFEEGLRPAWEALSTPETIHAFKLTLIIAAIAVPAEHRLRRSSAPSRSCASAFPARGC